MISDAQVDQKGFRAGLADPRPVLTAWTVEGLRVEPDGRETSLIATSFGSTEERARASWLKLWGKECAWPIEQLTFTREGGAL